MENVRVYYILNHQSKEPVDAIHRYFGMEANVYQRHNVHVWLVIFSKCIFTGGVICSGMIKKNIFRSSTNRYEVGAQYETEDCSQCMCVLGGVAQCKPQICPPCQTGLRPIKTATCVCLCEPCPIYQILCPTSSVCIPESSWCDGVQDCPDDELQCGTKDKESAKIVTKLEEKMSKQRLKIVCVSSFLI